MLPLVTIVGRTNVGKSSLLNRLAGKRISIVEDQEGVTRDRISTIVEYEEKTFELIDTGGFGLTKKDELAEFIEAQIAIAMEEAHLLLFMVDGRAGITPLDLEVAQKVRSLKKPCMLLVNKIDDPNLESLADEFFSLGMEEPPMALSAMTGFGKTDLMEKILEKIHWEKFDLVTADAEMKLAIVGRQNVGKSTYINSLAKEKRVIVSEIAGTTRDAVDVRFRMDGKTFIAIDTAGVKKKKNLKDSVEFFSFVRAEKAIARSDVVVFMIDISAKITRADKKLGEMIVNSEKPVVIAVNKWDLAEEKISTQDYVPYLNKLLPGLEFAPMIFHTAVDGKNKKVIIKVAQELFGQSKHRVGTGELNRLLKEAYERRRPPVKSGKRGKILYGTQVSISPPTLVLFVNQKKLFPDQYLRYLKNFLRDHLPFSEIPLRIFLRERIYEDAAS